MLSTIAKPFGWLLMWLYEAFGNYGIAIILFALLVRVILLPFMMKSKKGMMRTQYLTPRMKELEKKHGANKQKYQEELAKLYREEKINPMSGCLWSLIPFPILIALYQAIRFPLTIMMGVPADLLAEGGAITQKLAEMNFTSTYNAAYAQISQAQFITSHFDAFSGLSDKLRALDYTFLGMDLGQQPTWNFLWTTDWTNVSVWLPALGLFLIPILAAVLTFVQSRVAQAANPSTDATGQVGGMKTMMYLMPLMTLWFGFMMPAALGLYWLAGMLFSIIQDMILNKYYRKVLDAEEAVRREKEIKKEAEIEEKRLETERLRAENATVANPNTSKKKQQKQTRQEDEQKAAEWRRQHAQEKTQKTAEDDPSRVGNRRYARGRAYDPNRYLDNGVSAPEEAPAALPETETPVPAAPEEPAYADEADVPYDEAETAYDDESFDEEEEEKTDADGSED